MEAIVEYTKLCASLITLIYALRRLVITIKMKYGNNSNPSPSYAAKAGEGLSISGLIDASAQRLRSR